jgi:5-formyltetrahydrofolate cyclo-ligase
MTKAEWRRWAKTRPIITAAESSAVVANLAEWLDGSRPKGVLIYYPLVGEVDLSSLMPRDGTRFFSTRTPASGPLTVHELPAALERHRYGFLQPVAETPIASLSLIEVAMVPGVLFDRRGVRLGHGAGYFDDLLTRLPPGIIRIGVGVERLVVDALPADDTDVSMHYLATERGCRMVAR